MKAFLELGSHFIDLEDIEHSYFQSALLCSLSNIGYTRFAVEKTLLLLNHGAKISARDKDGRGCLHYILKAWSRKQDLSYETMLKLLMISIDRGADIYAADLHGISVTKDAFFYNLAGPWLRAVHASRLRLKPSTVLANDHQKFHHRRVASADKQSQVDRDRSMSQNISRRSAMHSTADVLGVPGFPCVQRETVSEDRSSNHQRAWGGFYSMREWSTKPGPDGSGYVLDKFRVEVLAGVYQQHGYADEQLSDMEEVAYNDVEEVSDEDSEEVAYNDLEGVSDEVSEEVVCDDPQEVSDEVPEEVACDDLEEVSDEDSEENFSEDGEPSRSDNSTSGQSAKDENSVQRSPLQRSTVEVSWHSSID